MATKKPVKKVVAKAPAKKAAPKSAPKKVVAKAPAKKAAPKPAPKKVVAKAPAKPAPKKVVAKAPAKPIAKKAAPKKVVAKAPAKPVAKKVAPKPAPKKVVAKAPAKPVAKKVEPIKKQKEVTKTVPAKKTGKAEPKQKTIITSNPSAFKKIDAFKTSTFETSTLRNESGKVIAHRKTSELKRKANDNKNTKREVEVPRSILDMSSNDSKTSFRYSDEDLLEFRDLITRKLDTAKAELQYLQSVIMRKDESGTEDTENKYQNMEDGSASMDREQFNQLASRQITFIAHLESALVRIENKTYGICRETGKLIDKARLRAVPHATLSIEAKNAKR